MEEQHKPAPLPILRNYIARKLAIAEERKNYGDAFETKFLSRLVEREHVAVAGAADEAEKLLHLAEGLIQEWKTAISDGRISKAEKAAIQERITALFSAAKPHEINLKKLL